MSNNQKRILWPALLTVLVGVGALVFAVARPRGASMNWGATTTAPDVGKSARKVPVEAPGSTTNAVTRGPVQVVRFTLYDAGIYPRQAVVEKGLVAITIEDLSGGTSGLVVERLNGNGRLAVATVQRFEKHWRGREEIQLQPGTYELHMAERPNNRATLVVAP